EPTPPVDQTTTRLRSATSATGRHLRHATEVERPGFHAAPTHGADGDVVSLGPLAQGAHGRLVLGDVGERVVVEPAHGRAVGDVGDVGVGETRRLDVAVEVLWPLRPGR